MDQDADYQWTPRRIGVGFLAAALAVALLGVMGWWGVGQDQESASYAASRPVRAPTAPPPLELNLDNLSVPAEEILFGGPRKDGIPALTAPEVVPVAEAGLLEPGDRIVGVRIGTEARAYPLRILIWHEAVNDELGGVPIAVVYCPLCDSVSVVDRRLDGETREFGISGLLHNSNVLLYDRGDDSLWSQLGFAAISGPNVGRSLAHLGWELTTLGAWREAHPEATVLSLNTGYDRDYRRHPYGDYFETDQLRFPVAREDRRLRRKDLVVGIKIGKIARAYPVAAIGEGLLRDEIDGEVIALAFVRASGSLRVVEAPARARVVYTFWFAWAAFHPDTEIYKR